MRGKRYLSLLVAMLVAITNIVFVAMPSVGAVGSAIVSDNFDTGYTAISSNAAATLASMQELCDMDPWWYSVKPTVFNKAADVNENTPLIASVINAGDNNMLRLTYHAEAGIGTNISAPTQANQFVYENNTYEVSFRIYTIGDLQIYGIGGKMVDGVATFYKNNILTKSGSATYMGDTETTSPACPAGTGISSEKWYTLKLVVNNGLGYYSVEILDKNGASIQRVGGINFQNGCPAISNIRFQAPTEGSVVYLDDYTVNKVEQDALLYEDDFNIYTGFSASKGSFKVGSNLFKEVSQFRALFADSQYAMGNAYLRTFSPVAYMPWNGHILTKESQAARGKLQLKFKFRIESASTPTSGAAFKVICADNFNGDIYNLGANKYTMFNVKTNISDSSWDCAIENFATGSPKNQQINIGQSYDVQLTFDLVNDKLETDVSGIDKFERSISYYNGGTALNSIKSIVFYPSNGLIADIDNFELKYLPESPRVAASGAEIIDYSREKVSATEGVNPAVALIKVPFTADMSEESLKNITLKAENATEAFTGYKGTYANGVYSMAFEKTLEPGTKYTLTVPTTVTNAVGAFLSAPYTYEFITGAAKDRAEMDILGININTVEDIVNGGTISVTTKYANTTNNSESCMMILAFYDENNTMLGSTHVNGSLQPKSINTNFRAPFTVPAADKLDVSKISRAAVYLWDNYDSLRPYCKYMEITKTSAEKK